MDALVEGDPFVSAALRCREAPRRIVGRRDRVLRKGVQDVGQHQFLMLLLVIEADLDQRDQFCQRGLIGGLEEFHHGGIDMPAIGGDFVGARAGQVAALVAGMPGAGADVIGIEQEGVVGVKRLIARAVLAEQELLEEPGGMGAVPFRRAGVRHRLDQLVLGAQGRRPALGFVPDGEIGLDHILGEGAGIGENDGAGVADKAAADTDFVTGVSGRGRERLFGELVPDGQSVLDRGSGPGKKPPRAHDIDAVRLWPVPPRTVDGAPAHASSPPFYFGCTTVWATYMASQRVSGPSGLAAGAVRPKRKSR